MTFRGMTMGPLSFLLDAAFIAAAVLMLFVVGVFSDPKPRVTKIFGEW